MAQIKQLICFMSLCLGFGNLYGVNSTVRNRGISSDKPQFDQKRSEEIKASICTIKYNALNQYLASTTKIIDYQATVLSDSTFYDSSYWYLEPQDIDGTFKLKNTVDDEYLGSYSPWYNSWEFFSIVVASVQFHDECDSRFIWKLEQDSSGGSLLKHVKTNAYIHMENDEPILDTDVAGSVFSLSCTGFKNKQSKF